MREQNAFSIFEFLIVLCVILTLVGVFAIYAGKMVRIAREIALQSELAYVRTAIDYYHIKNNSYPSNLQNLTKNTLTMKDTLGKIKPAQYVTPYRIDTKGDLLDPFMNPYTYDPQTGRVSSKTEGYERW